MSNFLVFAGIDGVAPWVGNVRRDQHARSKHHQYWMEDFAHVRDLGINTLRYGANWYEVNYAPHRFDWSQLDTRIEYAHSIGLDLWYVLQHKQVPDWLEITDPEFPDALCEYGVAIANRYPHLSTYFITVEPEFYARMGCLEGRWHPHRTDTYELSLQHFKEAILLTGAALKRMRRSIQIIHCDFAPGLAFAKRVAPYVDAVALDYYPWAHGRTLGEWCEYWYAATKKPLYIGETGMAGGHCDHNVQVQAAYVREVFNTCRELRRRGVDLRGASIYPTVTENFWWGDDQCTEYVCLYPPGEHQYEGDNAGGFYRCKAGTLERVPEPVLIEALQSEIMKGVE